MKVSSAEALVVLSRELGRPEYGLAILAEGNASTREGDDSFWIKASGRSLCEVRQDCLVRVRTAPILAMLDTPPEDEVSARKRLNASAEGIGPTHQPSTEAFMHAYLLRLPGVRFVAHTHPADLLAVLSTDAGRRMADERLFPDEIVLCGPASAWVPYVAPGVRLGIAVRDAVEAYIARWEDIPRTIYLQNHGLIALGGTPHETLGASLMAAKAGGIWRAALSTGQPIRSLTEVEVRQIHRWPDETFRRRLLSEGIRR